MLPISWRSGMLFSRRILTPVFVVLVTASAFSVLPSAEGANPCPNNTDYRDQDQDLLSDCLEFGQLGTNLESWDSDGDGLADARDIHMSPNDRSPQLGDIPVQVKIATLADSDQCDYGGADSSDHNGGYANPGRGHRFWDPYIGTGIVQLPTLESLERRVQFNDAGFTKGNHPSNERTLEPNVLVADIKVPQDINVFDRPTLDAFPYFGVQIGLTDEDAWDHDAVRLLGSETVLLFDRLPIVASLTPGADITRTFKGTGGSCPATITLSVHSSIRQDFLAAAVLASSQGFANRDAVLQKIGMNGARSSASGDNVALWAADHAVFKASGMPMEAEEKAHWTADLGDTDDWEHPVQWFFRGDLSPPDDPVLRAPSTIESWTHWFGDLTDCQVSTWRDPGEPCSWFGLGAENPLDSAEVEAVAGILRACTDTVIHIQTRSSGINCVRLAQEVQDDLDWTAAIVDQILAECVRGSTETRATPCNEVTALAGSLVNDVLPFVRECLKDSSTTCGQTVQLLLDLAADVIAEAKELLDSCSVEADSESECRALIQTILGAAGPTLDAVKALVNTYKQKALDAIAGVPNPCPVNPVAMSTSAANSNICGTPRPGPPTSIRWQDLVATQAFSTSSPIESCMSLKGLLGSPGLTLAEGAGHLRATLRDQAGNVLDNGAVRFTSEGKTFDGVFSTFVPLEWCGYNGAATLSVSLVMETAGRLMPVQQATFPLDLPAPDSTATYDPHYLVQMHDDGQPALKTTFSNSASFWTTVFGG
jgi:hypothetical protein